VKVVILAGGYGTRISEESAVRPKPMVEIGGMPIIWHIMKIYSAQGLNDFVICLGYKGHMIKDFFANYALRASDVTFDLHANRTTTHSNNVEPWTVTLIDTGDKTMTGGRIKRVREFVGDETFCLTYGDCLAALDVKALVDFHREQEALATLTAVQPPGRFGVIALGEDETKISTFEEKPRGDGAWISGGFFVLEPKVLDYIEGDDTVWEREPLETLAREGNLAAYKHRAYWQNMDSLRDKIVLESQWDSGSPPWKIW
jgi:glucose-1-phosphate cytidylyltransferase